MKEMMNMDLRQYRYFCAVVEEQSVTRAAERLRMAQPALTQQIRKMEELLGVRLIERAGRGIRITASGCMNGPSPCCVTKRKPGLKSVTLRKDEPGFYGLVSIRCLPVD